MKKLILFIISVSLLCVLLFASDAFARSVNPANISESNIALLEEIKQQCESPTFTKTQACLKKLQARYELEGKFQGTTRYAEKHYKKLSDDALRKVLKKLKQLRTTARDLSDAMMDPVEGELTEDKYEAEIQWISGEFKSRGLMVPR